MLKKHEANILILEDNAVLAANLQEMLEDLNYSVAGVAGTLTRAKKIFQEKQANLILADISLEDTSPGMDGIQIAGRLLKERKVPLIFLTAYDGEDKRQRTRYLHPAAYLIKPVQPRQLDVSVDFALFSSVQGREHKQVRQPLDDQQIFVKQDSAHHGIWLSDICYANADGGNCWLYTTHRHYYLTTNMGTILSQIGSQGLQRVHRSYSVNPRHVHSYNTSTIFVRRNGELERVPYTDTYREVVHQMLPRLQLD